MNFFLLVVENQRGVEKRYVYACSNTDAHLYATQFMKNDPRNYQVALLTTSGVIPYTDLSPQWLEENQEWLTTIRTQMAFLNGFVVDIENLQNQIKGWEEVDNKALSSLWHAITEKQLNPDAMATALIESLFSYEKPDVPLSQTPQELLNTEENQDIQSTAIPQPPQIVDLTHAIPPPPQTNNQRTLAKVLLVASLIVLVLTIGGSLTFVFFPQGHIILAHPIKLSVALLATASSGAILTVALFVLGMAKYCHSAADRQEPTSLNS
jgi:hypothetical protein